MANQQTSKGSDPSFVERIDVISNKDGQSTSITGGLVNLMYYESIMKDSVRATVTFVDAGNTVNGKTALDVC